MFVAVRGSSGSVMFVNSDHIRMIKPARDPATSRLIFVNAQGEEAVSVQGSPLDIARQINDPNNGRRMRGERSPEEAA